ncbi:hypothetical protein VULLAG_LOCUS21783 [Vulpes lagopus]
MFKKEENLTGGQPARSCSGVTPVQCSPDAHPAAQHPVPGHPPPVLPPPEPQGLSPPPSHPPAPHPLGRSDVLLKLQMPVPLHPAELRPLLHPAAPATSLGRPPGCAGGCSLPRDRSRSQPVPTGQTGGKGSSGAAAKVLARSMSLFSPPVLTAPLTAGPVPGTRPQHEQP